MDEPPLAHARSYKIGRVKTGRTLHNRQRRKLRPEDRLRWTIEPAFQSGPIDRAEIGAEREVLIALELERRRRAMEAAFHPRTHDEERRRRAVVCAPALVLAGPPAEFGEGHCRYLAIEFVRLEIFLKRGETVGKLRQKI